MSWFFDNFSTQARSCHLVIAGGVLLLSGLLTPATAGDDMMRGDRGRMGGGMGGMGGAGIGLGIGIGTGLIINELNKPSEAPDARQAAKPGRKDKKEAKKPDQDKKRAAKKPEEPPKIPTADTPPKIPTVDNPPPTTTDRPPQKPPVTVEVPPTVSPPDTPPVNGVPPTQTATSPPDLPRTPGAPPQDPNDVPVPGRYTYNHDEDCPQRGMGCAALIIDFQTHYFGDLEGLKDHLAPGCDVEYVTPQFLFDKELAEANAKLNKNKQPDEPARNINNFEWKRVYDAIARHRERVARGAELAVEVLRGEGYPAELRSCGSVGPKEGASLDRQEFQSGNYQAANKHVCGWVAVDFSCYSGYTPQVFDELNNHGSLPMSLMKNVLTDGTVRTEMRERACQPTQHNDCSQHAGYDFDMAMGQSGSSLPACALFTPALRDSLKGAFSLQGKTMKFNRNWRDLAFGGYYSDRGYRYCEPVVRDGYTSEPPQAGKPDTVAPISAATTTTK